MNRSFSIGVCDDEYADRKEIETMTAEICREGEIPCEICGYTGAGELLAAAEAGKSFELVLIDVLMPHTGGMELAARLREKYPELSIVFISCNRDMALQGYKVAASRYLTKPLDKEELREAVLFCAEKRRKKTEFLLPSGGVMRRICVKDIWYIYISGRKKRIVQKDREWEVNLPFEKLEEMLSGTGFVRCHQSYLVNLSHVKTLTAASMELENGTVIPVSKHRIKEVRKEFFSYMSN